MFGQIVIGPPGSGKSTFCHGMYQFLSAIGRKCSIINLDPANERHPYPKCDFDIRDFITVEDVMNKNNLGPNGGLMYALESIDENGIEILLGEIKKLAQSRNYLIFDCPGQVELFTHHNSLFKIFKRMANSMDARLCVVSLVDSIYLTSPSQYISILLLSLRSMLQLDLPQVNVISKVDMLLSYGNLPLRLDYYTEVQDLSYLGPLIDRESPTTLGKNFVKLTEMIGTLVEDFNLVSFEVLAVENKASMIHLLQVIDNTIGYSLGSSELGGDLIWAEAVRNKAAGVHNDIDIHERWIENKEFYDKLELEMASHEPGGGDNFLDEH
ncbi:CIC11C00000004101 [Sungouiella intermedia]|uniref:GPN-loop GTPase 2 n=1 Tax=Sungouiella intermedia TaxID=45354 RepID=A0A1L0D576_9ASCO|nr:CIC11C00000004101 [[Candida] intermedia]